MGKRRRARESILKILYQIEISRGDWDQITAAFWNDNPQDDEVKQFSQKILDGVHEHLDDIDRTIEEYSINWDLGRLSLIDKCVLRFASYEIMYLADIPASVSINEAIDIVKKYSGDESGKFINGILDKISHDVRFC